MDSDLSIEWQQATEDLLRCTQAAILPEGQREQSRIQIGLGDPGAHLMNKKGKYCIAWEDPIAGTSGKGAFLFDSSAEAKKDIAALRKVFPMNKHWLEDADGNRIELDASVDMDEAAARG